MTNNNYYKSLIGAKAIDKVMNRKGFINYIAFNSNDWQICWFSFKWEKGEYLREIKDLLIINSQQLTLDL